MGSIIRTFSLCSYIPFTGSLASSCIDQDVLINLLELLFASLQEDDNAPDREEVFYGWLGCIFYSACLCLLSTVYRGTQFVNFWWQSGLMAVNCVLLIRISSQGFISRVFMVLMGLTTMRCCSGSANYQCSLCLASLGSTLTCWSFKESFKTITKVK